MHPTPGDQHPQEEHVGTMVHWHPVDAPTLNDHVVHDHANSFHFHQQHFRPGKSGVPDNSNRAWSTPNARSTPFLQASWH
jgi:hypothetical protein